MAVGTGDNFLGNEVQHHLYIQICTCQSGPLRLFKRSYVWKRKGWYSFGWL